MPMWRTETDARVAAERLADQATNLVVPWWSTRERQLTRLAAQAAIEKVVLGRFSPLALVFSERLRELVDHATYRELSTAIAEAEDSLTSSLRRPAAAARLIG